MSLVLYLPPSAPPSAPTFQVDELEATRSLISREEQELRDVERETEEQLNEQHSLVRGGPRSISFNSTRWCVRRRRTTAMAHGLGFQQGRTLCAVFLVHINIH